jgi:transcriptional/translational regulatory protein YebC/TACO1
MRLHELLKSVDIDKVLPIIVEYYYKDESNIEKVEYNFKRSYNELINTEVEYYPSEYVDSPGENSREIWIEDEFDEDEEEGTITIYGDPKSYAAIQKHLEECGFEEVGGDFTYIPNDLKDVTPEQRETLDKMVERLEEFDDVQTVYTNMKPASEEEE